jgi:D-psicose/D-tagatose/L-ribulose 3-epimerase
MKYGVQMMLFTDSFGEEKIGLLRKAKDLGFDGVELLIADPASFPVKAVRRTLAELGLGINFAAALGSDTNAISPRAEVRAAGTEFLKRCIDVAYEVTGGRCVIGGPNYAAWCYLTGLAPTRDERRWAVEHYREACEYAARKQITLTVEVVNRFETHLFNTIEDACGFCAEVGLENAKVQPDTYHMNIEEKSWGTPLRRAGARLGYFHVIENDRGTIGTGLVDWPEVFRALRDVSYDGWLTVESFTMEFHGLAGATKVWRDPAPTAERLAKDSLVALREFEQETHS